MHRYENYKPSGIQWLGDMPSSWNVMRNIGIFDERKQINSVDMELLSVTINRGVIKQDEITSKKDSSNEDKSKYKVVQQGDLAYNKMRMWQGAIGVSNYDGIVSPAYVVLRPRNKLYSRYFHYLRPLHESPPNLRFN
jgi:type I restriction enzyme S subunit